MTLLGRFDSRSTSATKPNEPPENLHVESTKHHSAPVISVPQYSRQFSSNSATTVASKPATVVHHKSTLSTESTGTTIGPTNKDGVDDLDNTIEEEGEGEQGYRRSTDMDDDRPETPRASVPAPSIAPLLPVPSVLDSESPSKYGFDDVMRTARDMTIQSKRRTISGPDLFEVSSFSTGQIVIAKF